SAQAGRSVADLVFESLFSHQGRGCLAEHDRPATHPAGGQLLSTERSVGTARSATFHAARRRSPLCGLVLSIVTGGLPYHNSTAPPLRSTARSGASAPSWAGK